MAQPLLRMLFVDKKTRAVHFRSIFTMTGFPVWNAWRVKHHPEFTDPYPRQNRRWSVQERISLKYQKRRASLSLALSALQLANVLQANEPTYFEKFHSK
ncbi:hypothetical protein TNCV_3877601 [Trichonephila clavipes]|uniref:Uncharacterized protein n=1 Tax=Trichonephila clavipes TaxID=2585209 RepID=A0A8X6VHQ3_TRICX|nr:hypothetical protein TNCV_3877601 [Trichonephila clavipes]